MWGVISYLLSLFASSDDAMEIHGAVQWLFEAYKDYRNRVKNNIVGYKAFMEEFHVRLNMPIFLDERASYSDLLKEMTDRDKVKHILENRKFTEDNFSTDTFKESDAIKMIAKYNAIGTREIARRPNGIQPISEYPQEAMENLAAVFCKHKLLCPDINANDLRLLLTTGKPSCNYMIPPLTRNGDLGLVLNILGKAQALSRKWSSIICSSGMLLTSSGNRMKENNLSAAMHKYDGYQTRHLDELQRRIEQDVFKALACVPNAIKNLRN